MALYCPNCGTENNDTAKHCTNCGVAFVQSAAAPAAPVQAAAPSNGTNTWALVGFIVSLVSAILCCGLLSLPSLIFSIIGMSSSKKNNQGGWGLALTGVIISGIYLLFWIGYFILVFIVGVTEGFYYY